MAFGHHRPGFDSTGGYGVYLALTREATSNGHGARLIECPIPETSTVLNIDPHTHPCAVFALMVAGFLKLDYSDPVNQLDPMEMQLIAVNKKNLFVNPVQAERILQGTLLVFRPGKLNSEPFPEPYVADKGSILWKNCELKP